MSGRKHSDEVKKRLSELNKGKKMSEEAKRKIGKFNKGKKLSEEHKKKIGKAKLRDKNPNWHGGISLKPYPVDWTRTLRRSIRERDNYICKRCNQYGVCVHHIDYNKENCNPDNLITLCNGCNLSVNKNRKYWTNYFQAITDILEKL